MPLIGSPAADRETADDNLVRGDRLDQGIGHAHLVRDGHGLRDRVGELGELGGAHDGIGALDFR